MKHSGCSTREENRLARVFVLLMVHVFLKTAAAHRANQVLDPMSVLEVLVDKSWKREVPARTRI